MEIQENDPAVLITPAAGTVMSDLIPSSVHFPSRFISPKTSKVKLSVCSCKRCCLEFPVSIALSGFPFLLGFIRSRHSFDPKRL